jgi:hypothetical protein
MTFKTQITFKEYLKLLLSLTYRKPIMILILFVDLIMAIWILSYYMDLFFLPKPTIYQFITLILISIVQPLVIINTIRQNYYSSNHLREQLEIKITETEIKIQGQSFFTEIKMDKLFKIVEYKNWFLFYQNNLSAIVIPKNDFQNGQLEEFTRIVSKISNVPVDLKSKS